MRITGHMFNRGVHPAKGWPPFFLAPETKPPYTGVPTPRTLVLRSVGHFAEKLTIMKKLLALVCLTLIAGPASAVQLDEGLTLLRWTPVAGALVLAVPMIISLFIHRNDD